MTYSRTLPGDNERLMAQIEEITKKLSSDKRSYSIRVKNNIPTVVTDPESAIVQESIKLKTKIYGFQNLALKGSGLRMSPICLLRQVSPR